jgi:RimJ/RimL family protein N-acetyltransferase
MELNRFESPRLFMEKMQVSDFSFVRELVNSEGWLKFIGDRNVHSDDDAKAYIAKTLEDHNIQYWISRLKSDSGPIGIVSFNKREFLPCNDIGFAFLPRYMGQGFAFEAADALLNNILADYRAEYVLAITNEDNTASIRLLAKFGFFRQKELFIGGVPVQVYAADTDKLATARSHGVIPP